MNTISINSKSNTIEMSKKFAASAKRFGTEAYKQLQEARRDYPTYRVIVKSTRCAKHDHFKGLTYDFMESYIKVHDDDNGSIMAHFNALRATSEEAKAVGAAALTYGETKAWFFNTYPAFAEFQKMREKLLSEKAA